MREEQKECEVKEEFVLHSHIRISVFEKRVSAIGGILPHAHVVNAFIYVPSFINIFLFFYISGPCVSFYSLNTILNLERIVCCIIHFCPLHAILKVVTIEYKQKLFIIIERIKTNECLLLLLQLLLVSGGTDAGIITDMLLPLLLYL